MLLYILVIEACTTAVTLYFMLFITWVAVSALSVIQETADGVSLKDNIQRMSVLYCVPKAKRKAMTESIVKRLQGTYGPFDEDSQEETELAG